MEELLYEQPQQRNLRWKHLSDFKYKNGVSQARLCESKSPKYITV